MLTTTAEKELLLRLQSGDETAFRQLFDVYYKYLTVTAYHYLHESEKAKDMAQDAFVELWNRKDNLQINSGLKSYLRQTVVNKCLNYLKREKRLNFSETADLPDAPIAPIAQQELEAADMQQVIQTAIDRLPDRCRIIFCMSRFEEKTHKEIAQALGISTKTIETQMTRALRSLRAAIRQHTTLLLLISTFF